MNKVMIIDDKKTVILPLEIALKKKGIEVVAFTNPNEAIEYLKNNSVDVLLTDYHMEPEINGDEVIKRVREFNKDVIIYLQTAYSETLPADEMLEKYDIQGYIDKGEGQEKNIQLIKASLKQAELVELVKKQRIELDAQTCRNEFLGKFLNRLLGEIGERGMAMSGSIIHLEELQDTVSNENRELYLNSVNIIKSSSKKLNDLIRSLEISNGITTVGELARKLNNLFEITFSIKDVSLNFNYTDNYQIVNCNQEILLHILVDLIENLVNKNEKEININCKKINENLEVELENIFEDEKAFDKMIKLSNLDTNIKIYINNKKVYLQIHSV